MYICDECGALFEEPVRKREYSEEYGDSTAYYCPHCGSEEYTADECPSCHGAKNAQDPVCRKCKLRVKGLLRLFVSDFSRAERANTWPTFWTALRWTTLRKEKEFESVSD